MHLERSTIFFFHFFPSLSFPALLVLNKREFLCSKHHSNSICVLQAVSGNTGFLPLITVSLDSVYTWKILRSN